MTDFRISYLLNAVIFATAGLLLFAAALALFIKTRHYDAWKQVVEEHNVALAILLGAIAIGVAIIISSAVH